MIFAEGKTPKWVVGAVGRLQRGRAGLPRDASQRQCAEALAIARFPTAEQDRVARTFWLPTPQWKAPARPRVRRDGGDERLAGRAGGAGHGGGDGGERGD